MNNSIAIAGARRDLPLVATGDVYCLHSILRRTVLN